MSDFFTSSSAESVRSLIPNAGTKIANWSPFVEHKQLEEGVFMTLNQTLKSAVACVSFALALGSPAHASWIGSTVSCGIVPTPLWTCDTPSTSVIDPGSEFRLVLGTIGFFDVDFSASSLTLTWISGGGLGMGAGEVATFGGLSPINSITGFSTSSTVNGFDLGDLSFVNGTLTVGLNGSSWSPRGSATVQFDVANNVPEPGSLALLGLGLTGLALVRRRRK
jgi:hypothetical protein